MSAEIGCRYQHFKGNVYLVRYLAAHADTKEPFVVYEREGPVYEKEATGEIYVRPLTDWEKPVTIGGNMIPRFVRL
jgi:hypothetical protein